MMVQRSERTFSAAAFAMASGVKPYSCLIFAVDPCGRSEERPVQEREQQLEYLMDGLRNDVSFCVFDEIQLHSFRTAGLVEEMFF